MTIKVVYYKSTSKRENKKMSDKVDLRVRRTKKALADAFMQLLSTKTFDEITVNELCEAAGIRRATFYKHYSDKFDFLTSYAHLLRDKFDRLIWKADKPIPTVDYYVAYARQLVIFINNNSAAIDNLYRCNLFPTVMNVLVDQNYKDTRDRLRISRDAGIELSASVEIVASMCAGGVASTIYNWLKSGRKMGADELADQIGSVIAAAIEKR